MKTSSGLLLGVLFTLVVVIVAVVIYFNTRPEEEEEKPETLDGPTLPGISDLTVSRTDSPDSDSETYTIEPYTIEYAEGDNEKELSKNITFTLNWKNNDGFDDVKGIKIEHYIDTATDGSLVTQRTMEDNSITLRSNFTDVSYSITGDGKYSFVGKNRFKITAILTRKVSKEADAKNQEYVLYDGRFEADGTTVKIIPGNPLDIKEEDLTATIGMALALTKTFELELQDESTTGGNAAYKKITNTMYTFTAAPYKFDSPDQGTDVDDDKKVEYKNIELVAQDEDGKKFKFRSLDTATNTMKFWGLTNVPKSDDNPDEYKLLNTDSTEGNAAIIIFANSSKGTDYQSLKIVAGTTDAPKDMYLYGIKGTAAFRTLDDPVVSKSYKLSNTRHWKIETQT